MEFEVPYKPPRYEVALFRPMRPDHSSAKGGVDGCRYKPHFKGTEEFDQLAAAEAFVNVCLRDREFARVEFYDREHQHRIIYGTR